MSGPETPPSTLFILAWPNQSPFLFLPSHHVDRPQPAQDPGHNLGPSQSSPTSEWELSLALLIVLFFLLLLIYYRQINFLKEYVYIVSNKFSTNYHSWRQTLRFAFLTQTEVGNTWQCLELFALKKTKRF